MVAFSADYGQLLIKMAQELLFELKLGMSEIKFDSKLQLCMYKSRNAHHISLSLLLLRV